MDRSDIDQRKEKVGYRQVYKYRKLHADMPKTLTVVLSLVQTRKNQLSALSTYYRKSIHRSVSISGSTSLNGQERAVPLSKNSTKIISSCMFIAFVDYHYAWVAFENKNKPVSVPIVVTMCTVE